MQNLDVISINLWNIVISLCNLVILFLILKHFLFRPVERMLKARQDSIDETYRKAQKASEDADLSKAQWQEKMANAQQEAQQIEAQATEEARRQSTRIVKEAQEKADTLIREANTRTVLEYKKAEADMKKEIADVSTAISEKILEREIKPEDHQRLIDSVSAGIGEDHDADQ